MVTFTSTTFAQASDQFAKATDAYAKKEFATARDGYEALVRSGETTANVFYNLGNSYFRLKHFGRAILNYERALALDPQHPEAQANLRVARDEARALELQPTYADRLLQYGRVTTYAVAASAAFWIALFTLLAMIYASRRSLRRTLILIVSLTVCGLLGYALYAIETGPGGRDKAVVLSDKITARLATAENAGAVLALPPGSEVKIEQQRGDWVYATLPNSLRGWLPAKSVERVRL